MSFFHNLLTSIKNMFGGKSPPTFQGNTAKRSATIADYQQATSPRTAKSGPDNELSIDATAIAAQQIVPESAPIAKPRKTVDMTELSEVVEYEVSMQTITGLDTLVETLGLIKRKITYDRGVISLPFDASGCDFETKRQLAHASASEFNMNVQMPPNNIACTEIAKRTFSSIKAFRDECFVCGNLFISVNQNIDDEGYILAEITNTHNGHAVFFDIPATITSSGSVNIDYDLIESNIILARDAVL